MLLSSAVVIQETIVLELPCAMAQSRSPTLNCCPSLRLLVLGITHGPNGRGTHSVFVHYCDRDLMPLLGKSEFSARTMDIPKSLLTLETVRYLFRAFCMTDLLTAADPGFNRPERVLYLNEGFRSRRRRQPPGSQHRYVVFFFPCGGFCMLTSFNFLSSFPPSFSSSCSSR